MQSLDIIIPSYRLNEDELAPILSLEGPPDFNIRFIVIADNPLVEVPSSIRRMAEEEKLNLIINEINLGFSGTRNKGIDASKADWILLLDDDIVPQRNMLHVFCDAIRSNPECIGYIGITNFPEPINTVTKAFTLNVGAQYNVGRSKKEHVWFPTANIALNKKLLGDRRFLTHLTKAGEDIEFFSRNSFENDQKYIALPEATVIHPWWENGKSQLKRMFNYGWGKSDIIDLQTLKDYSFYTFPNTPETIFLLLVAAPFVIFLTGKIGWLPTFIAIILIAEYLTTLIKLLVSHKTFSPAVAFQMMLQKNVNESGFVTGCIYNNKFHCLTKRLDVSFNTRKPSAYVFNRWRILKLAIIVLGISIYFAIL